MTDIDTIKTAAVLEAAKTQKAAKAKKPAKAPKAPKAAKGKTNRPLGTKAPKGKPAKGKAPKAGAPKAARADSKQALFIAAMRTAKGISIGEAAERFGWQAHTVRGAVAGALRKKLGLDVKAERDEKRGTVYRLPA